MPKVVAAEAAFFRVVVEDVPADRGRVDVGCVQGTEMTAYYDEGFGFRFGFGSGRARGGDGAGGEAEGVGCVKDVFRRFLESVREL